MLEELIAGLGLLHLMQTLDNPRRVYAYRPGGEAAKISWEDLPWPDATKHQSVTMIRALLHVAAFHLFAGAADRPLGRGVEASIGDWRTHHVDPELFPWFKPILDTWGETFQSYRNSSLPKWQRFVDGNVLPGNASVTSAAATVKEYFARLLLWAHFALEANSLETDLLAWNDNADAFPYWEAMSAVKPHEVTTNANLDADNALIRLLRIAAVGAHKVLTGSQKARRMFGSAANGHPSAVRGLHCELPAALRRPDLEPIRGEYQRTTLTSQQQD
jgi:hypothetical protein